MNASTSHEATIRDFEDAEFLQITTCRDGTAILYVFAKSQEHCSQSSWILRSVREAQLFECSSASSQNFLRLVVMTINIRTASAHTGHIPEFEGLPALS